MKNLCSLEAPLRRTIPSADAYYPRVPPLNLELSSRCNLKCPYCANPTLAREYRAMDDAVLEKIKAEAEAKQYSVISLHGTGEPLLRRDLETVMKDLARRHIWLGCMATNGSLLSEDRARSLYEAGVRWIFVSLDTLNPDLYRRTRGGDVEKTIANIRGAAKVNPDWNIQVGLMNHKEQFVDEKIRADFNRRFGEFPKVTLHVYENGRFPGAVEDWSRRGPGNPNGPAKGDQCSAPAHYLTIAADGRISLCCADQNVEHPLGDVTTQSIESIWFDSANQETFRNVGLGVVGCPEVCVNCVLNRPARGLNAVDPVLYAPMRVLLRRAADEQAAGQLEQAMKFYEHAFARDPYSKEIKASLVVVETVLGRKSGDYLRKYTENTVG